MVDIVSTFIGPRLEIARESRGLNQMDLVRLSGLSQSQISKFETGEKIPNNNELKLFSKILDYPINFFTKKIRNEEVHIDYFRKGKSVPAKTTRKIKAIVNRVRSELNSLFENIEMDSFYVPEGISSASPQSAAREIRRLWKIPKGPIINLFEVIEFQGIPIVPMQFSESEKFSGCAIQIQQGQPAIIFNKNHQTDRIRFSVAHELGHIFLHHFGNFEDSMIPFEFRENLRETQANDFASEFLMPSAEIKNDLMGLSIERLQNLKFKWRVSMAAILQAAKKLEAIDQNRYIYFRKEFSARRWLTDEPGKLPIEEPRLLKSATQLLMEEFNYSVEQIANEVGLYSKDFSPVYLGKASLRQIKSN
ncbi:helix-turn-helix domain-containing protein [Leptospira santarosai]|uniref:helix-turn-helix domain-containing protein n=1 Tax=Leptospira santarosai TaxID=28183 RepID=UPI0002BE1E74|nr:XRE family transcriptional regulator [Leptospira santarosai]EMO20681.1 PF06114 domain protein [Leptospira santarosai str. HAI134]MDI7184397.1 XRE family transcriptional regulator [Leptospira santarosai]